MNADEDPTTEEIKENLGKEEPCLEGEESTNIENILPAGDAIGETAYSERFVLNLLLKLTNLETLLDEIEKQTFEDDMSTLWDMAAERDVILFLLKHEIYNLFSFALPVIESSRIIEIITGIVGNMCCEKEGMTALLNMEPFLKYLLEYLKSHDTLILIQIVRMINSVLFYANDESLAAKWMEIFESIGYSESLYYILNNSSNVELLLPALENLNSVCSYLNVDKTRTKFFSHFVTPEALEAVTVACTEVVNKKSECQKDDLERMFVISLQITMTLIGFDKSIELYSCVSTKQKVAAMISLILFHFEREIVKRKQVNISLVDIIDSTNIIVKTLRLSQINTPEVYFMPSFSMWKAIFITKLYENSNDFEDDNDSQDDCLKQIAVPLSYLIYEYMLECTEEHLSSIVDVIGDTDIMSGVFDEEIRSNLSKRLARFTVKEHTL